MLLKDFTKFGLHEIFTTENKKKRSAKPGTNHELYSPIEIL